MDCPLCGGATRVIDSRPMDGGIRRRRECERCGRRFTTHERVAPVELRVVKSGSRGREAFSVAKLLRVIRRVCRGCPVPEETIQAVASRIEVRLGESGRSSVPSREIARLLHAELDTLDALAAERFAINYRDASGRLLLEEPEAEEEPEAREKEQYELFGE